MKEKLINLGVSEEVVENVMSLIKKEYVSAEKYSRDTAVLNDRIAAVSAESEAAGKRHREDMDRLKIDNAVDLALSQAGAITGKAVRALIDMDKVSFDDKGNVCGVTEQVEQLAGSSDTGYLFNRQGVKGVSIGVGEREPRADVGSMSYSEICEYLKRER